MKLNVKELSRFIALVCQCSFDPHVIQISSLLAQVELVKLVIIKLWDNRHLFGRKNYQSVEEILLICMLSLQFYFASDW